MPRNNPFPPIQWLKTIRVFFFHTSLGWLEFGWGWVGFGPGSGLGPGLLQVSLILLEPVGWQKPKTASASIKAYVKPLLRPICYHLVRQNNSPGQAQSQESGKFMDRCKYHTGEWRLMTNLPHIHWLTSPTPHLVFHPSTDPTIQGLTKRRSHLFL